MIEKQFDTVVDVVFIDDVLGGLRGRLATESDVIVVKLESVKKAISPMYWETSIGREHLTQLSNVAVNGFICLDASAFDWVQIPDDYLGGNK